MTGNRDTITSILPPRSTNIPVSPTLLSCFPTTEVTVPYVQWDFLIVTIIVFVLLLLLYYCIVLYDTKEQGTLGWELIIVNVRFHGLCISKKFQVQYQMCFCKANINFIFKQSKKKATADQVTIKIIMKIYLKQEKKHKNIENCLRPSSKFSS